MTNRFITENTRRLRCFAGDVLRVVLVFMMAFSLTWWAQSAHAEEGIPSSPAENQPADPPGTGATTGLQGVGDIVLFQLNALGNVEQVPGNSDALLQQQGLELPSVAITAKGQSLSLLCDVYDSQGQAFGATPGNYAMLDSYTWSSNDPSVVVVTNGGVVSPVANGVAVVTFTGERDGQSMSVSTAVEVTGQNDEWYVESISLGDANGALYDPMQTIEVSSLNDVVQLSAIVTVVNPATGETVDYSTVNGLISSQTDGAISDIAWSVSDSNLGYVEPLYGQYRPAAWANVWVKASSNAGLGGSTVSSQICVAAFDDQSRQQTGARPQDSLTVNVYYEEKPDEIVKTVTYPADEIESLGTEMHTYTCIGKSTYAVASARGVLLSTILERVGLDFSPANTSGISLFSFVTADSGAGAFGETISYNMLFGQTRYFCPNADVGNYVDGAVSVPPMLALESNFRWAETGVGIEEDYSTMTTDTRFRMLFGQLQDSQTTTNKQIYWINTINVVLAGAPPAGTGEGDGGNGSGSDPAGGNEGDGAGNGTGNGTGDGAGDGNGSGNDAATGTASGDGSQDGNAGYGEPSADSGGQEAGSGVGEEGTGDAGHKWSVYQMISDNTSGILPPDEPNPWEPFVWPIAAGALAAGAVQSGVWYRRQLQPGALRGAVA